MKRYLVVARVAGMIAWTMTVYAINKSQAVKEARNGSALHSTLKAIEV